MTPEHMTDEELRRLTAIRESIRRDSGNSTEDAYADRAWLAALLDRLSALRATEAPPVGPAPQMPTREQIEALKVPKTYGVGGLDDYDRGYNAALSQVIALLPSASQPSTTAAPVLTEDDLEVLASSWVREEWNSVREEWEYGCNYCDAPSVYSSDEEVRHADACVIHKLSRLTSHNAEGGQP